MHRLRLAAIHWGDRRGPGSRTSATAAGAKAGPMRDLLILLSILLGLLILILA
ncbi:MAG TPA: hypothetical protein VNL15_06265 [Dehalococcoidia bacterium]|nr:hypothetical protein [Dehalococcoidia bacterium]